MPAAVVIAIVHMPAASTVIVAEHCHIQSAVHTPVATAHSDHIPGSVAGLPVAVVAEYIQVGSA